VEIYTLTVWYFWFISNSTLINTFTLVSRKIITTIEAGLIYKGKNALSSAVYCRMIKNIATIVAAGTTTEADRTLRVQNTEIMNYYKYC